MYPRIRTYGVGNEWSKWDQDLLSAVQVCTLHFPHELFLMYRASISPPLKYAIETLEKDDLRWSSGDLLLENLRGKWKTQRVMGLCILLYRRLQRVIDLGLRSGIGLSLSATFGDALATWLSDLSQSRYDD
jgi:hypothetical protein